MTRRNIKMIVPSVVFVQSRWLVTPRSVGATLCNSPFQSCASPALRLCTALRLIRLRGKMHDVAIILSNWDVRTCTCCCSGAAWSLSSNFEVYPSLLSRIVEESLLYLAPATTRRHTRRGDFQSIVVSPLETSSGDEQWTSGQRCLPRQSGAANLWGIWSCDSGQPGTFCLDFEVVSYLFVSNSFDIALRLPLTLLSA